MFRIIISYIKKALFNSENTRYKIDIFKSVLKLPIIFDITSLLLQLSDIKNISRLEKKNNEIGDIYTDVFKYNKSKTLEKIITTTRRAEIFYEILKLYLGRDINHKKLLIIGPRNIQELFIAWLYGFKWKKITGIDLYSTNKKIKVMNMEEMDFEDTMFDCVSMSATLVYAKSIHKALSEISRILKPGGILVFGSTYDPNSVDIWQESSKTGLQIHEILKGLQLDIIYWESREKINLLGHKQTGHYIACIKKGKRKEFDYVDL